MNTRTDLNYEDLNTKEIVKALETSGGRAQVACLLLKNRLSIAATSEHIDDTEGFGEEEDKFLNEELLRVADIMMDIVEENEDETLEEIREMLYVESALTKDSTS